jgi:hypothetical protein
MAYGKYILYSVSVDRVLCVGVKSVNEKCWVLAIHDVDRIHFIEVISKRHLKTHTTIF